MNPFEQQDPTRFLAPPNQRFASAPELALLRSQPCPGNLDGAVARSLGEAVQALADGRAGPGTRAWAESMGLIVSQSCRTVKIDVSDSGPVMTLYRKHGVCHLGPHIRDSSGFVEFKGAQVSVIFPL